MKQRIVAIVIVSAALITAIGCGNAEPAQAEVVQEAEVVAEVTEAVEEVAEDTAEAEEAAKKAEEEAAKAAEEEAAEKAEEERIAALRAEIDAIDTEALASEMTGNGNTDGVNALTSLVESYTAGETDPDAFMESYKAILADKEAFDAEYAAEQEAKAAEEAKKAEETKPTVTIPDWFDAAYYAANNADVVAALGSSPEALYGHYTAHGKSEGRAAYEGDPGAVAKAESPASAGEPTQTEGGAASSDGCPWQLFTLFGEGLDSYFYTPAGWQLTDEEIARLDALQVEMCNRYNNATGADWTKVGEWNGRIIVKWFPG